VKKLLITTTMLTALANPANALFQADQFYKSADGWAVGYQANIGPRGICMAQAYYPKSGTKLWISSTLEATEQRDGWYLSLYNPEWKLKDGAEYWYNIKSSKQSIVWKVGFSAIKHKSDGKLFLISHISVDLANALAFDGKGSFTVYPLGSNKPIVSFQIDRSAVAIRDVVACRNDMIAKLGPPSTTTTTTATPPSAPPKGDGKSFGTGFYVSENRVLTNWHVVAGCSKYITIKYPGYASSKAWLKATDKTNDLALLETERPGLGVASFEYNVRLGAAVYAFGFPLAEVLSQSGNFVPGSVSSLKGVAEDSRFLQMSVPVQVGNSGGPLLNASGGVIGIIQSKLDAVKTVSLTGDIPQNVNFAIKSMIAMNFLQSSGVSPMIAAPTAAWDPADIAEGAQKFTVQVTCE
jgi:serine protease Do